MRIEPSWCHPLQPLHVLFLCYFPKKCNNDWTSVIEDKTKHVINCEMKINFTPLHWSDGRWKMDLKRSKNCPIDDKPYFLQNVYLLITKCCSINSRKEMGLTSFPGTIKSRLQLNRLCSPSTLRELRTGPIIRVSPTTTLRRSLIMAISQMT